MLVVGTLRNSIFLDCDQVGWRGGGGGGGDILHLCYLGMHNVSTAITVLLLHTNVFNFAQHVIP